MHCRQLTIASLLTASLGTGFFCFEIFTEFEIGPDILRLEESNETKPGGRPSSPVTDTGKKNHYFYRMKVMKYLNVKEGFDQPKTVS